MDWTYKKSKNENGFTKLGEITVRLLRLVAYQQLARAETQLRAQNLPANLTKPLLEAIPKKELVQEFPCLIIKETTTQF